MEIIVEGNGKKLFTPDQVIMHINFIVKANTYEEVLKKGSRNVELFINEVLVQNGINFNDLKTRSFVIKEEKKYNENSKQYEFDGYSYNQNAILKFDYNKEKMFQIMVDISKMTNPPMYQINFGLKNEKESRDIVLTEAYNDALSKANVIAIAAGKNLKQCCKVDFKPFNFEYISETRLNNDALIERTYIGNISNTFTPEDVEISETLYCLWITY